METMNARERLDVIRVILRGTSYLIGLFSSMYFAYQGQALLTAFWFGWALLFVVEGWVK
jgi:hypothetical protein